MSYNLEYSKPLCIFMKYHYNHNMLEYDVLYHLYGYV